VTLASGSIIWSLTINWYYGDIQTLNADHGVVELVLCSVRHDNKSLVATLEGAEVSDITERLLMRKNILNL
jgi:hypothetical protein